MYATVLFKQSCLCTLIKLEDHSAGNKQLRFESMNWLSRALVVFFECNVNISQLFLKRRFWKTLKILMHIYTCYVEHVIFFNYGWIMHATIFKTKKKKYVVSICINKVQLYNQIYITKAYLTDLLIGR